MKISKKGNFVSILNQM